MKPILTVIFIVSCITAAFAQQGKVVESLEFDSKIVKYPVKYSIYFPPDYETSNRSYPVLYLLHGYSDDDTGWIQYGEANMTADKGIKNGDFAPCIIVMPDGKLTWYSNAYDGSDSWEDMFIQEFIPFIESNYRIRSQKRFRAIAGLSMGGNGALFLAMHHSELFSSCVALSAATFTDEEISDTEKNDHFFGNLYGPKLANGVSDYWKKYCPLHIMDNTDLEKIKSVHYYLDCGDDDFLYKGNAALHVKMRDLDIPHEFRMRNGGHSWEYWRVGLYDGLKFISQSFHK